MSTKTQPTTPAQANSADALVAVEEAALARSDYATQGMLTSCTAPFDTDIAPLERADRCVDLQAVRGSQTAELACHLFYLREGEWLEVAAPVGRMPAAENFKDVVDMRFNMSIAKANQLANQWAQLLVLGLHSAILSHVVWDRLCELGPGIRAGVIREDNIGEWLPLCEPLGNKHALRSSDLQHAVKMAVQMDSDGDDVDESGEAMRTLKITMTQANADIFLSFQELLKRAQSQSDDRDSWLTDGEVCVEALAIQASMLTEGAERAWESVGLSRLKEAAERICPGVTAVFVAPDDVNFTEDHVGARCVDSIYQGFAKNANGEETLRFMLATDPTQAAEALGIDEATIRRFPLAVSDQLRTRHAPRVGDSMVPPVAAPAANEAVATEVAEAAAVIAETVAAEKAKAKPKKATKRVAETPAEEPAAPVAAKKKVAKKVATSVEEGVPLPGYGQIRNTRPDFAKLSPTAKSTLVRALGQVTRDAGLATTDDLSRQKSLSRQEHEGKPDAVLLVAADVVEWLFVRLDDAGIVLQGLIE